MNAKVAPELVFCAKMRPRGDPGQSGTLAFLPSEDGPLGKMGLRFLLGSPQEALTRNQTERGTPKVPRPIFVDVAATGLHNPPTMAHSEWIAWLLKIKC